MFKYIRWIILIVIMGMMPRLNGATFQKMDAAKIYLAIKKLNVLGSVLYIAAHPDDENTAAMAYFSNQALYRTAYLSLTRGDGGQNLIGTHTGELLGVIRTHELLEARKLDGAEQYFTRAIDFGYSKSPQESMDIWGRQSTLSDIVWVIRKFQPDIILTRFTPEVGGHGHHLASAKLAIEAFHAAADTKQFPEQLTRVSVWQAKRILWNTWGPAIDRMHLQRDKMVSIDLGSFNPILGKSYGEISAQSRSMHKSQGFGRSSWRGSYPEYFMLLDGDSCKTDLLDGVITDWSRIPGATEIPRIIGKILQAYDFQNPAGSIPQLVQLDDQLSQLPQNNWVKRKRGEINSILQAAAGLWIDFLSDAPEVTPGDTLPLTMEIVNRSNAEIQIRRIKFPFQTSQKRDNQLLNNQQLTEKFTLAIPEDAPLSQRYWLRRAHPAGHFTVEKQDMIGLAKEPGPLTTVITLNIAGRNFDFQRPLRYRWSDPVQGEKRRDTEILPPIVTNTEESLVLFPNGAKKQIDVFARNHRAHCDGEISFIAPDGWQVHPQKVMLHFSEKDSRKKIKIEITPGAHSERAELKIVTRVGELQSSFTQVDLHYDHIPYQTILQPATVQLLSLPLQKRGNRIGYLMGSGDEIPKYLTQLGYAVDILDEADLARGNLANYDAIITGIRAYNTRDFLADQQSRLLQYVKDGGTLVLQYNTNRHLVTEHLGPYPFKISRSRVSVEAAPVRILKKDHPLLNIPNIIHAGDFDGWVQERGLYFLSDWDGHYQTVISSNDPEEKANAGGLLYLPYGKGVFVYSSLSWFRQLPAGVPGAYRLFINLVSARN